MQIPPNYKRIVDFQDFNYERVAFDINFMSPEDRKALKEKLKRDYVNHLWGFDKATYFAIWNCDFQGFTSVFDIYFDSDQYDYTLVKLCLINDRWYYYVFEEREVCENRRFMP